MFDRYEDLQDQLDRQLLERPEPPCHIDAKRRLENAGVDVDRIVRVDPDCTLYVARDGTAMTAWDVKQPDGTIALRTETGFSAWPEPLPLPDPLRSEDGNAENDR